MWEDFLYKKNYDKWYKDYIEEVDLSKIKWIKLNTEDLSKFYQQNYYDKDVKCFALSTKENSLVVSPFGFEIASYGSDTASLEFSHMLGIVTNRKGTNTIVSKVKMIENYKYLANKDGCTYIDYIEVNSFFRQQDIYKSTIEALTNFIDMDKDILLTYETQIGKVCRVHEIFKKIFKENGFNGTIKTEDDISNEISQNVQNKLLKNNEIQDNKKSVSFDLIWGGYKQPYKDSKATNNPVKKLKK